VINLAFMSKSQLESVSDVIDAFGGVKAMCAIFGGVPSRFGNYKMRGCFPDHMHMRIYVEACERGLNIAPELIGMKPAPRQRELVLQAAE
jgi:hypothetical protein